MRTRLSLSLVVIVLLLTTVSGANARFGATVPAAPQAAVGSGFTFQGQLKNANNAVNGNCNMAFRLYDDAATGTQIGTAITTTVPVSNSLFTVMLNNGGEFGTNAFNGDARWLEVSVKCAGDLTFTALTPRQQIIAAPYAQYALSSGNASQKPFVPLYRPQTLNLAAVDPALVGFFGGFTDGRYGYLVPNDNYTSGKVARVDLENFSPSGVTTLDLTSVDAGLKGFMGGFTDGRYGYFVPEDHYTSGKVARIDLQSFVTNTVTVLDLTTVDASLKGYRGGFTDGRYGYFVPCCSGATATPNGKAVRVDLQDFTAGGVTVLDLTVVNPDLAGFQGGFTDGRYGYFVPAKEISGYGKVARVDLQNFSPTGVTVLDLEMIDSSLRGFQGYFYDGRYGYFVPHDNGVRTGTLVRVDLQNFTTSGVAVLDLTTIDSGLKGFSGGFTDGHYGYLVPNSNASSVPSGKMARVDLQNFSASGVTVLDLAATDPSLKGFDGGFTDGRYGYLVPNGAYGSSVGTIARIQLFSGVGSP